MQSNERTHKDFMVLLICDFISSFGDCFMVTALTIFRYKQSGSLLAVSLFPMIALLSKVAVFFVNAHVTFSFSFRTIFIMGEILTGLFALALFFAHNNVVFIVPIFAVFSLFFSLLETYRAEFLRAITTNEQMSLRQSVSRAVNVAVVLVGSLCAGIVGDRTTASTMYLITASVYPVTACIIAQLSKHTYPVKQQPDHKLLKESILTFWKGESSIMFIGSAGIVFIGGAASLLTLSYIFTVLHASAFRYTMLMSALAVGGALGSLLINIPNIKVNLPVLSFVGMLLNGALLFLILCQPNFYTLLLILTASGMISAFTTTHYAIMLFTRYTQEAIRSKFNLMSIFLSTAEAASKPVAGLSERMCGNTMSFMLCGIGFILLALFSRSKNNKPVLKTEVSEHRISR